MEKFLTSALSAESWEAEDNDIALVTDSHTPDFQLDDFAADIDNEITGGNYAREPLDTTEITVEAGGVLKFDAANSVFDNAGSNDVTITNAEAGIHIFDVTTDADSPLGFCSDFGSPYSCSNSTFTIQWSASGIWTIDLVP
jgi:hypothetical protein